MWKTIHMELVLGTTENLLHNPQQVLWQLLVLDLIHGILFLPLILSKLPFEDVLALLNFAVLAWSQLQEKPSINGFRLGHGS